MIIKQHADASFLEKLKSCYRLKVRRTGINCTSVIYREKMYKGDEIKRVTLACALLEQDAAQLLYDQVRGRLERRKEGMPYRSQ